MKIDPHTRTPTYYRRTRFIQMLGFSFTTFGCSMTASSILCEILVGLHQVYTVLLTIGGSSVLVGVLLSVWAWSRR